jgi:hypothetical protein
LAQAGTELTYDQIIDAACSVISDNDIKRLSNDAAYKRFRTAYLNSIPSINDFTNGTFSTTPPSIDFEKPENLELAFLQMIQTRNWDSILKSFKIKSTGAPNEIARKLGYTNSAGYIIAVKKLLAANDTLRASLSVLVPNPFKPTDTQAN